MAADGTLLDDQVTGDVVVADTNAENALTVDGGLSGGGTLDLTTYTDLDANQTETFNSATIVLGASSAIVESAYTADATSGQYVGGTLTFGPNVVLEQSAGSSAEVEGEYNGSSIVNDGAIDADGSSLTIYASEFINSGTVVVGGTTTLDLYGSFINTGAATIEAGGTLELGGSETVPDLGSIDNGGVLDIAGTLDARGGTIDVAPGTMFGTIELSGTIENAVIDGDGGTFIAAGGALLDDTVVGDLVVSYDGGLSVYGGLSGGGTIDLSATNDTLYAATTETFDDTTAVLGSGSEIIEISYTYDATIGTYLGGTLTLGPNFVVDQGASAYSTLYGENGGATIVNDGTINADGSSLAIEPGTFVNAGTITVGGTSTLAIYGTFTNTGSITIDAGGTLEIAGTTDLASLASIENAGVLDIYYGGTLDAGGGTIDVGSSTVFSTLELSGVIENAAIEVTGGSFIAAGGTLDNDQIVGDVAVSNEYSSLTVEGGLSGGGTLDLSGYDGAVYALQSETFDNATLLLGSSDSLQVDAYTYDATSGHDLGGTLTLGPDFVVTEGTSTSGYLEGSYTGNEIINEGTIEADGTYTQISPSDFVNAGTIEVASGETLEISSSFTNTGLLTIGTGATLEIAYTTDLASLASSSNAGVLYVYYGGTLDAGGGTIDISPTTAFATLELSGTIENATLNGDGGSFILAGGTLQNDQIAGDLVVTNTYNGVNVLGGLSGGGTLDLSATNDSIYAVETETFDQATVLLGNGSNLIETGYSYDATSDTDLGQTLTFGPDFTLGQGTGTNSYVYSDYTGAKIINEGTIDADGAYTQFSPTVFVNTGTITVGGTDTFQVQGSFTNTGSITIDAGGTLEMAGTTDLASLASISNQGLLYLDYGTLDAGGGTIDIAAATAFASLELSGTIENATLLGAGGTFIDANGTLNDDQVAGDVAISNNYAGLAVLGGLSGGGTLDLSPAYGVTVYARRARPSTTRRCSWATATPCRSAPPPTTRPADSISAER